MQVPRYFSHMGSVWEVWQPSAVTTNTTMTAISEALCHAHKKKTTQQPSLATQHLHSHSTPDTPRSLKYTTQAPTGQMASTRNGWNGQRKHTDTATPQKKSPRCHVSHTLVLPHTHRENALHLVCIYSNRPGLYNTRPEPNIKTSPVSATKPVSLTPLTTFWLLCHVVWTANPTSSSCVLW